MAFGQIAQQYPTDIGNEASALSTLGVARAWNTSPPRRRSLVYRSWMPEEFQVQSCEHRDNANIHY
jgi:hypothetical protein